MATPITLSSKSDSFLKVSVKVWFAIVVAGQFIFALYILGVYGISGLGGDFERWNSASAHGYMEKDVWGNLLFGSHVLMAAIITIGGPLQITQKVRSRFPRFHRINGRLYISSAILISVAGFYLTWIRGNVGGLIGSVFISLNGLLILICAFYTIKKAVGRDLKAHKKWALRLYLSMSGVWFFRVLLMLWLTIHQAPVGFDMETFQGPALNLLYVLSYIFPIAFLQLYFRVKKSKVSARKWILSIVILFLVVGLAIGTFSAALGMWLPKL